MKKLINLKCINCGADLSVEEKRDHLFCQYCGAKLIFDNDNEYIYRHIDEADVKRAETEQLIKLKELEIKEKQKETEKEHYKILMIISIILGIIGFFSLFIGSIVDNEMIEDIGFSAFGVILCIWVGRSIFKSNKKNR